MVVPDGSVTSTFTSPVPSDWPLSPLIPQPEAAANASPSTVDLLNRLMTRFPAFVNLTFVRLPTGITRFAVSNKPTNTR